MYSKKQLANFIAFDLETVPEFKNLKTLKKEKPRLGDLWDKRCEYLRNKHEDNKELTNDGIYQEKAGLQAEYGKIVCISIAYLRCNEQNVPVIKSKSFSSLTDTDLSVSPALILIFSFVNIATGSHEIISIYTSAPYSMPSINS